MGDVDGINEFKECPDGVENPVALLGSYAAPGFSAQTATPVRISARTPRSGLLIAHVAEVDGGLSTEPVLAGGFENFVRDLPNRRVEWRRKAPVVECHLGAVTV